MDTSQRATIERELRIAAAPEVVFTYLIDPARLVTWMGSVATLDPRPGGVFRLDYHGQWVSSGEFIEVDPPRRVVFTWGWEMQGDPTPPGSSRVEFSLQGDHDGTLLRLVHRGLPSEAVGPHADGWDHFLPGLATATGAHAAVSNAEEAQQHAGD